MATVGFTRRSFAAGVAAGFGAITAAAAFRADAAREPPSEWDGLVRAKHKRLDHVYILPGVDFSVYRRIRLDLVDVAFDKDWKKEMSRDMTRRMSDKDFEAIRTGLSQEFRKVFADELGKGGYALVGEDGEDVLRVNAMISDLYITAPDTMSPGITRTYVANSGRMRLIAELHDSVSGQLLGRAIDTEQGRNTGWFELATRVSNVADARRAMSEWAKVLRTGLDEARGRRPG
jgi:hypothetical protein